MMFFMTVLALALGAGMYWFTYHMTIRLLEWHLKRDKKLQELYALLPNIRALVKRLPVRPKKEEATKGQPAATP